MVRALHGQAHRMDLSVGREDRVIPIGAWGWKNEDRLLTAPPVRGDTKSLCRGAYVQPPLAFAASGLCNRGSAGVWSQGCI